MKLRLLALTCSAAIAFSLMGCGSGKGAAESPAVQTSAEKTGETSAAAPAEKPSSDAKVQ